MNYTHTTATCKDCNEKIQLTKNLVRKSCKCKKLIVTSTKSGFRLAKGREINYIEF